MKFCLTHADRLTQAAAQLGNALFDLVAIRRLENDSQQRVAELSEIPRTSLPTIDARLRQTEDRRAHDLL